MKEEAIEVQAIEITLRNRPEILALIKAVQSMPNQKRCEAITMAVQMLNELQNV